MDRECNIHVQQIVNLNTLKIITSLLNSKYCDTSPRPTDLFWTPGQDCIARFQVSGEWCRGRVLNVDVESQSCDVRFVDFGTEDYCSITDLRKDLFAKEFPIQCFTITIEDVEPLDGKCWDKSALDFLQERVVESEEEVLVTVRRGGTFPLCAASVTTKDGTNIGALMVSKDMARRVEG